MLEEVKYVELVQKEDTHTKLVKEVGPFVTWLYAQKEKAKFAWTVIVIISALFGYQVTINKNPTDKSLSEAAKVAVESNMSEVRSQQAIDSANKIGNSLHSVSNTVFTN